MKILFLHGWQSVPGGVKPTFLAGHGHQVFNPQLPDDDFAEAARIAQAEFDMHQPDVVVGSSRGGAIAMNAGAYGLKWFQWRAPLVAYMDPSSDYGGGPRSLRTYDIVDFNEDGTLQPVILHSVNPMIGLPEGDLAQWASYTGFVPPIPLSY